MAQAGYEVTGCDVVPQPEYPYPIIIGDALSLDVDYLRTFDLIWASPPCQNHTAYRRSTKVRDVPRLIAPVRGLLESAGVPWIIENVPGAPLMDPVLLCGSMFGLAVQRHRLFETSFRVPQPPCAHPSERRYAAASNRDRNSRSTVEIGVWRVPVETQRAAMGIARGMTVPKLSQAIPPAYAKWLASHI